MLFRSIPRAEARGYILPPAQGGLTTMHPHCQMAGTTSGEMAGQAFPLPFSSSTGSSWTTVMMSAKLAFARHIESSAAP